MTHPQTQDDEALVEVMARAAYLAVVHYDPTDTWYDRYPEHDPSKAWPERLLGVGGNADRFRRAARAALTALRNHEGRK